MSPPITLKMLRLRPHVPSANEGSQSPSSEEADVAFVVVVVVTDVVVVVVVVVLDEVDEDNIQSHLRLTLTFYSTRVRSFDWNKVKFELMSSFLESA